MKVVCLSIFFFFASGFLLAQVVLTPKVYKFGKVIPGKTYHLKVKLKNPTAQTLSMWNLHADCSCTVANIKKAVLKTKESTLMTIDYTPPEGETGFKNLTVSFQVYSQDAVGKMVKTIQVFQFSAELYSSVAMVPNSLVGQYVLTGTAGEGHGLLKLDPKIWSRWKFVEAHTDQDNFTADVKPLATPGVYDVGLITSGKTKPGVYLGEVEIAGKDSKDKIFHYPFKAVVGSLWRVFPTFLDLGVLDLERSKKWESQTHISQTYGKKFKIIKIQNQPDWLQGDVRQDKFGNVMIIWKLKTDELKKAKDKNIPSTLIVQTDAKQESSIELPLRALWPAPAEAVTPTLRSNFTATPSVTPVTGKTK